jgi:hypothetical protein
MLIHQFHGNINFHGGKETAGTRNFADKFSIDMSDIGAV